MSIAQDKTPELWRSFMPYRKKIKHAIGTDLYCVQIYDAALDFNHFTADTIFEKWAAIEVSEYSDMPDDMLPFTLTGGLYAVFDYVGRAADFGDTWHYIFYEWLPASDYQVDTGEHFEILGSKYKNNDPTSKEEVWIPIRKKV